MTRVIILVACVLLPAGRGATAQPNEEPQTAVEPQRTVQEGVYTEEQASWGAELFEQYCSRCHSHRELAGNGFEKTWVGRTVYALYFQIFDTMPLDQPAGLSGEQYAALVAYILKLNEYPAGEEALGWSRDELVRIRIRPTPKPPDVRLRAVLHHQAAGLQHRPGAVAPDRRGARRLPHHREPAPRPRLPRPPARTPA